MILRQYFLSAAVFGFIILLLSIVQLKIDPPVILLERFVEGGGWAEIILVAGYGAFIAYKMQDPGQVHRWRMITWTLFSVVFFGQMLTGLLGADRFLMTGELHLPVPAMILTGPIYRAQVSVMPFLFISTVLLTGPAWCSHLCYFGALDGLSAGRRKSAGPLSRKFRWKHSLLILIIVITLIFRLLQTPGWFTTSLAIGFGAAGLGIILFVSARRGKMIHCIYYCPVGTIVNYLKFLNPFRMSIDDSCTECMRCTMVCDYDALNIKDIAGRKPGLTCTYCGDCLTSCPSLSIRYRFLNLSPGAARKLYLFLTVSIHAVFLALGRI